MAKTLRRRRLLVAAQAVLVAILVGVAYVGLLKPSSVSPLSGAGVPGGPGRGHQLHAGPSGHQGNGHRNRHRGGPGQASGGPTGGGSQAPPASLFAGSGAVTSGSTAPFQPESNGPPDDEYLGAVAALKARAGIGDAKAP